MIIRDTTWERLRTHFNLEEKVLLRESISGRLPNYNASTIDIDMLPEELQVKLVELLAEDKQVLKVGRS